MLNHLTRITGLCILCISILLSACGGSSGGDTLGDPAPTATVSPSIRPIQTGSAIVINFIEGMDTNMANYSITGTMAGESDGGVWSQTTVADDTLTISPTGGDWTIGSTRTLIIDVQNTDGDPLATMTLTYDIYNSTLYFVDSNALNDTGNGLIPDTAKQTIRAAVTAASNPATVVVNAGTYVVDSTSGVNTHVVLKEGVSLFGAYSADYTDRDTGLYTSTLSDSAAATGYGAIAGSGGISVATIIDGFTINGTNATTNARAIRLSSGASPTIKNNTLNGGTGGGVSMAIDCSVSSPVITNNIINGGTSAQSRAIYMSSCSPIVTNNIIDGGTSPSSRGIMISGTSTPVIEGNVINGGTGNSGSIGININSGSPIIQNNTISGGSGTSITWGVLGNNSSAIIRNNTIGSGSGADNAYSIFSSSTSPMEIQNNILFTRTGANTYCIYENQTTSTPNTVQNNNFVECNVLYHDANNGCGGGTSCNLTQINALADITGGASGNVSADPLFVDIDGDDDNIDTMGDNDWHFNVGSPASVTAGGLNGIDEMPAWSFTDDKDGDTRPVTTNPWSMGAYEP